MKPNNKISQEKTFSNSRRSNVFFSTLVSMITVRRPLIPTSLRTSWMNSDVKERQRWCWLMRILKSTFFWTWLKDKNKKGKIELHTWMKSLIRKRDLTLISVRLLASWSLVICGESFRLSTEVKQQFLELELTSRESKWSRNKRWSNWEARVTWWKECLLSFHKVD